MPHASAEQSGGGLRQVHTAADAAAQPGHTARAYGKSLIVSYAIDTTRTECYLELTSAIYAAPSLPYRGTPLL